MPDCCQHLQKPDRLAGGQRTVFDKDTLHPFIERVGIRQVEKQQHRSRAEEDNDGDHAKPHHPGAGHETRQKAR